MIAQVVLLFGGLNGYFSDIALDWISTFERKLLYFLNDADIFSILNVVGRDEMPEDLMAFFINLMKMKNSYAFFGKGFGAFCKRFR